MTTSAASTLPLRQSGAVLLVSCYELGHQPLGIAWPKAFLEQAGYVPDVLDLAVEPFDEAKVRCARFVAIAVPMHTALRLGVRAAERIRRINPDCFICFHGLYALLNADYLLAHVADAVLGGELEGSLVALVDQLTLEGRPVAMPRAAGQPAAALERLAYPVPDRRGLPSVQQYVQLDRGDGTMTPAGYVEASRGCLHLCLHCPIPPVYGGRFFAVPRDVVLEDIRRVVAQGAGHITFGDPDFLNGPGHAIKLVRALHEEFPAVTYDFTAKIEHILAHRALFPEFGALGCVFVVSAVESLSDVVLANLEKGHTAADVPIALDIVRRAGIALRPSFVTFTPWTTLEDYERLLDFVLEHDWIPEVDPVQFAIRLLIPPGSSLVSSSGMRPYLGALDAATFSYQWAHPDPRMDRLHGEVRRLVEAAASEGQEATATFEAIREAVRAARGVATPEAHMVTGVSRTSPPSPRLTESWFCCAEPTETQMDALGVGILPAVPTSLEDEMASLNVSMYDPRLVQPMRDELTRIGFEELRTPEQVDAVLATTKDTTLVLVNSVCGCAARNARPAAAMAIQQAQRPQKLLTVFAGQDADATNRARSYFAPYPPSSPQMGLFKDGKLVFMLERRNIEGRPAQEIAADLMAAFERYC